MLIKAIKKWSLNKNNIIMIGDKTTDKISAKKRKLNFITKVKK